MNLKDEKHQKAEGYIELKFGPRWKYISAARGFIQNFLAISSAGNNIKENIADKISMAASELLENAVKYASGEETHIFVSIAPMAKKVIVSVENHASGESIDSLEEAFKRISKDKPLEAYLEAMKTAATREDGKSQLGLVRIRYETGGELNMRISDDNMVTITLKVSSEVKNK